MPAWQIAGQYMETCNCNYVCPCIATNMAARPTEGECKVAIAMHIETGEKDGVKLDGLSFIVVMLAPGPMIEGGFKVGLIIDETASEAQAQAISEIATGAAGGPMEALGPLVGEIAGVERRPISFEMDGLERSVTAGELVDQALSGTPSPAVEGEPLYLDNAFHPVSSRLALATARRSRFHAFGIDWEDASGLRNGHFAPFAWSG